MGHDLIEISLEAALRRNCMSFNLAVCHLCWESRNGHMFLWQCFSTLTGFSFLALNKNRSGNIISDQSDSRVKWEYDAHSIPEIKNIYPIITNHKTCFIVRFALHPLLKSSKKSVYFQKMTILTHSVQISTSSPKSACARWPTRQFWIVSYSKIMQQWCRKHRLGITLLNTEVYVRTPPISS